jgi:ribA/ribD-fused uncharacterized protein
MNKQFTFFWQGPFSQWHRANFTINGVTYNCAEQYMMHQKALLFADYDVAKQIMASTNPKEQKALGRKIKNFDMHWWNENCIQIVFRGNHGKFSQNKRLYDMLMNTTPNTLVEASPFDNIWGIGIDEKTAIKTPQEEWKGTNWLGYTLTNLREFFEEEERIEKAQKNVR